MSRLSVIAPAAVLILAAGPAWAGRVLDRVRAAGVVHCGGFERPGLAEPGEDGTWRGLEVDLCRAAAAAVFGRADRIVFNGFERRADFTLLAKGGDDILFLSGAEIAGNHLAGRVVPGPAVFIESHAVMVPADAPEHHLAELDGNGGVCFMSGTPLESTLPSSFAALGKPWRPVPYSEDGEMIDAYNTRQCHALASELTSLAPLLRDRGVNDLKSRILPEAIVSFPIVAATGTGDGRWSGLVAWIVDTLLVADRSGKVPGIPAPLPGLARDWQSRMVTATGGYGAIFERNLGATSPLGLPRGMNTDPGAGGALAAPFVE